MQLVANVLTPALVLAAPLLQLIAGLVPVSYANTYPRINARLNSLTAWLAFACAIGAALLYPYDTARTATFFSYDLPGNIGDFSLSTYINNVTIIMLLLVSFVGVVVSRYSKNYLDGEPNQGKFYKWLSLTLAAILFLIISGNLLMFSIAWIATSVFLHQLLIFYKDRQAAVLSAHKKFIASRIGDACLLIAIFLIGSTLNTLEFEEMFSIMSAWEGSLPLSLHWAAVLIVTSAALKSAQFPFHGWLIQVMEAPTPVSALLHAGIVNAGAFLVIRMSPVVSFSSTALALLAIVGLITLALASMVMLTQTSIKVSLAWSTTAQMGFMLLECGLGLYSLALLHLIAHSLYKAHAFLASGSGVDYFRAPVIPTQPVNWKLWRWALALIISALITLLVAALFDITVQEQPALIAVSAIITIAMSQVILQALKIQSNIGFLLRASAMSAVVCVVYFALHHLFDIAIVNSVLPEIDPVGSFQYSLVILVVLVFIGLQLLQQMFTTLKSPFMNASYVHLQNGLYIDVYITRILQRIWPAKLSDK